jgi:hypothetical protein
MSDEVIASIRFGGKMFNALIILCTFGTSGVEFVMFCTFDASDVEFVFLLHKLLAHPNRPYIYVCGQQMIHRTMPNIYLNSTIHWPQGVIVELLIDVLQPTKWMARFSASPQNRAAL